MAGGWAGAAVGRHGGRQMGIKGPLTQRFRAGQDVMMAGARIPAAVQPVLAQLLYEYFVRSTYKAP